jgi:hypothetical protein
VNKLIKECVYQFEDGFTSIQKEINKLKEESQLKDILESLKVFKKQKEEFEKFQD